MRRTHAAVIIAVVLWCAAGWALELVVGDDEDPVDRNPPLPEGAVVQTGGSAGTLTKVALSPDGKLAATASENKVLIWDTASARAVRTIPAHEKECHDVRFSADGKTVFSCSADSSVREWDAATGEARRRFEGHEGAVRSVACSPDGQRLASADAKGIRIWDLKSGKQLHLLTGHKLPEEWLAARRAQRKELGLPEPEPTPLTVDALVFSPDGRTLVSEANDVTARIWDALRGRELRMLPDHDGENAAVALSPDGTLGVSTRGDIGSGTVPRLRIWQVATGRMLRTLVGHLKNIVCDAFSPDSRYVLSGAKDWTLRQWEVDTGVEVRRFQLSCRPLSVAYGPDGRFAVTVSQNEGLAIWGLTAAPKARGVRAAIGSLDEAWQKLAAGSYEDRTAAFSYYCTRVAAAEAAADLQDRLRAKGGDGAASAARRRLIEKLDDQEYAVRVKAYDELAQMGEQARAELAAAAEHPSPEVRSRVGALLNAIGGPADFRSVLAVEVLGVLQGAEAKAALEKAAASSLPCAAHAKALLARAR